MVAEELGEVYSSFKDANIARGLVYAGAAAASVIPGEAFALRGGATYLRGKLGMFGARSVAGGESVANAALRRAYLNAKFDRVGNLNYDISYRGYASKVESLEISAGTDKAVFYSGKDNAQWAARYAKLTGRTTLEQTSGGRYLNAEHLYERMTPEQADKIWGSVSKQYALSASGEVHIFVKGSNPFRIFNQVELPILQTNPNVTAIISEIDLESAISNTNRFSPRY